MTREILAAAILSVAVSTAPTSPGPDWHQWGGPNRDFTVEDHGLATAWPRGGPEELWRRPLGEGYSAITAGGGHLYTMYRTGEQEHVVALDAASGRTVWDVAYESPTAGLRLENGPGPHAAPLVLEDRIVTAGTRGELQALARSDGEILWRVDLWTDRGGTVRDRGYSSSPVLHDGAIVSLVGGEGGSVVAFDPDDGSVLWVGGDLDNGHSSPIVVDVAGQEQVVAFLADRVAGFEVGSGRLLWDVPHETNWGLNISTPVFGDDDVLYVSSAYSGGSRAIQLSGDGNDTTAEELWFTTRMRVHFGTVIRVGDRVFGSTGDFGPSFLVSLDLEDGEVIWQDRGFAKANLLYADGKVVLLDEDGVLAVGRFGDDGLDVTARTQLFDSLSWTVPTLVGTRLYARNRQEIVALELGG